MATTEQVYVETLVAETGPVVDVQVVIPTTPVIPQTPVPVGATALVAPVTIVVKTIVEPRMPVPAFADVATVGVALATVVVSPDVGAVEL